MLNTIKTLFAKYQVIRFYVGLLAVGIIFTVIAILILKSPKEDLTETTAEILEINEEYDADSEIRSYFAEVRYTVDGTEYTGTVGADSDMKVGDKMTICYRISDLGIPMNTDAGKMGIIILGIGVVSILASVVLFFRKIR